MSLPPVSTSPTSGIPPSPADDKDPTAPASFSTPEGEASSSQPYAQSVAAGKLIGSKLQSRPSTPNKDLPSDDDDPLKTKLGAIFSHIQKEGLLVSPGFETIQHGTFVHSPLLNAFMQTSASIFSTRGTLSSQQRGLLTTTQQTFESALGDYKRKARELVARAKQDIPTSGKMPLRTELFSAVEDITKVLIDALDTMKEMPRSVESIGYLRTLGKAMGEVLNLKAYVIDEINKDHDESFNSQYLSLEEELHALTESAGGAKEEFDKKSDQLQALLKEWPQEERERWEAVATYGEILLCLANPRQVLHSVESIISKNYDRVYLGNCFINLSNLGSFSHKVTEKLAWEKNWKTSSVPTDFSSSQRKETMTEADTSTLAASDPATLSWEAHVQLELPKIYTFATTCIHAAHFSAFKDDNRRTFAYEEGREYMLGLVEKFQSIANAYEEVNTFFTYHAYQELSENSVVSQETIKTIGDIQAQLEIRQCIYKKCAFLTNTHAERHAPSVPRPKQQEETSQAWISEAIQMASKPKAPPPRQGKKKNRQLVLSRQSPSPLPAKETVAEPSSAGNKTTGVTSSKEVVITSLAQTLIPAEKQASQNLAEAEKAKQRYLAIPTFLGKQKYISDTKDKLDKVAKKFDGIISIMEKNRLTQIGDSVIKDGLVQQWQRCEDDIQQCLIYMHGPKGKRPIQTVLYSLDREKELTPTLPTDKSFYQEWKNKKTGKEEHMVEIQINVGDIVVGTAEPMPIQPSYIHFHLPEKPTSMQHLRKMMQDLKKQISDDYSDKFHGKDWLHRTLGQEYEERTGNPVQYNDLDKRWAFDQWDKVIAASPDMDLPTP